MQSLSRRQFLAASAALAAVPRPLRADPLGLPIGLQLYTVQEAIWQDFDGTLQRVADIGYRAVETGLTLAGRSAQELRQVFDRLGLAWTSAHVAAGELQAGLQKTLDTAHAVGLKRVVCAFPIVPASMEQALNAISLDDWRANADLFNKIAAETTKAGIVFAYHNHNIDFREYGGVTGYDELLARTDPGLVKLQLDCGWVAAAGRDPIAYLDANRGRYVSLHVKDIAPDSEPNTALKMKPTEVGKGTLDWPKILAAARKAGIGDYYVEQEPPFATSPLDSIAISYRYLHLLSV